MSKTLIEQAKPLVEQLRKLFAQMNDTQRADVHRQLLEGYCQTCAHSIPGDTCWNCFESRGDRD